MSESPRRRYWDSNLFIALIKNEEGRAQVAQRILQAAARGETEIVTSAITLVEVIKTSKESPPLTREDEEEVHRYFQHEYLLLVPFGPDMGERARSLIWEFGVRVRDAIHVASSLRADAQVMETYNGQLHRLNGHPAVGSLLVREPAWEGDSPIEFGD